MNENRRGLKWTCGHGQHAQYKHDNRQYAMDKHTHDMQHRSLQLKWTGWKAFFNFLVCNSLLSSSSLVHILIWFINES